MNKYKAGQTIYIVANNREVLSGTILKYSGGLYTIKLSHGISYGPAATRLKEHRLYATKNEANKALEQAKKMSK